MVWVDCPKCELKDTCKLYEQMKTAALQQKEQYCAKGCK